MKKTKQVIFLFFIFIIITVFYACMQKKSPTQPGNGEEPETSPSIERAVVKSVARTITVNTLQSEKRLTRFNYSHSDGWSRLASNGMIGMVIQELIPSQTLSSEKALVYKRILPNGLLTEETVSTGDGTDISVLIYDSQDIPYIFTVGSDPSLQQIVLYSQNASGQWDKTLVASFEKGGYIYELSGEKGSDNSMHLLALNTSRPATDPYYAHQSSRLFYMTNKSGAWVKEQITYYNTLYLYDDYVMATKRQDLAIDSLNNAHIAYGVKDGDGSSKMYYATNESGQWKTEVAFTPLDDSCDAGWDPTIAVNKDNIPVIAWTLVERVPTLSADYAQLRYSTRIKLGEWKTILLMDSEDGYVGTDGGGYTGALSQLIFDNDNHPHIVYSDIASSHADHNYLLIGQIRYLYFNGSDWESTTLYRQPSSDEYQIRNEMHGHCFFLTPDTSSFHVIGQEFIRTRKESTYNLIHLEITR